MVTTPSPMDDAVSVIGQAGLSPIIDSYGVPVALLALLAYNVFEIRKGRVDTLLKRTEENRASMRALAIAVYRVGQMTEGIDPEAVRQEVSDAWPDDVVFPTDFDHRKGWADGAGAMGDPRRPRQNDDQENADD